MKLLYLVPTLDESNGWGRYAAGFLREAKTHLGDDNVIVPDPATLRSGIRGWKTPFFAVLDKYMLGKQAEKCDLIHTAYENLAPLAMLLSIATGKPYVVSVHGTYADLRVYPWTIRWLFKVAFARADAILPVSSYTNRLIKKQFPEVRTVVIPGGFTHPRVHEREKGEGVFRILSVGALKPRKGFHTLIKAIDILAGKKLLLDIVGPKSFSEYSAKLEKMVQDMHLEKNVIIHGRIPQEELDRFFARADLFVLPSEHDGLAFEGLGLVYLEALAHGVPVIGSRDSGAEDVIRDGVNGFLVEPGNPEELAEKIAQLHGNPEMRSTMGSKGSESINDFRWEVVGEKMNELYTSCLA